MTTQYISISEKQETNFKTRGKGAKSEKLARYQHKAAKQVETNKRDAILWERNAKSEARKASRKAKKHQAYIRRMQAKA